MRKNSTWIQSIPVISTAHMPGTNAIADLKTPYMLWDQGGLVWVEDSDDQEAWVAKIAEQLRCPDGWVRLDSDGPIIEGLPTYNWDPEVVED